jgi:hypothetical protein
MKAEITYTLFLTLLNCIITPILKIKLKKKKNQKEKTLKNKKTRRERENKNVQFWSTAHFSLFYSTTF